MPEKVRVSRYPTCELSTAALVTGARGVGQAALVLVLEDEVLLLDDVDVLLDEEDEVVELEEEPESEEEELDVEEESDVEGTVLLPESRLSVR